MTSQIKPVTTVLFDMDGLILSEKFCEFWVTKVLNNIAQYFQTRNPSTKAFSGKSAWSMGKNWRLRLAWNFSDRQSDDHAKSAWPISSSTAHWINSLLISASFRWNVSSQLNSCRAQKDWSVIFTRARFQFVSRPAAAKKVSHSRQSDTKRSSNCSITSQRELTLKWRKANLRRTFFYSPQAVSIQKQFRKM